MNQCAIEREEWIIAWSLLCLGRGENSLYINSSDLILPDGIKGRTVYRLSQ